MKKIININLSGRVIPIEDSAYEHLKSYIESLRRYFAKEDGRDEIISDIESRIAELMSDKVRKGSACITDADVEEIIGSIGRPEDFEADNLDETASNQKSGSQQQYSYTETRKRNRLYRDTSDKMIGGVCSGLAAYLNTDPAIVRILFAIITFGGFGLGFLIYILLWIILPTKDLEGYSGKRLYRNPDDKMFGGVAGGLAAYFNKDAKTVRLIFVAPIILNILLGILNGMSWNHGFDFFPNILFGSLTSTAIVIYVVLWIVLPEARSNYEKMEMRGQKVDLNSIRQNVQDGMGNVKDRMKDWSEEVKESAQNIGNKAKDFANTRGKAFATEFGDTARRGGQSIGHIIGVIFKVFFLFVAGSIAFGLFVGLMALVFSGAAWWPINNFLWTSNNQQMYAWGTLIFFLIVPLVGFIIWLIRRITRSRNRGSSYLGWIFGVLWALGWVAAMLLTASITRDFREYEGTEGKNVIIDQPSNGKMVVVVSEPELEYTGSFGWMNDGGEGWDMSEDSLQLSTVKFNIVKSLDSNYHVITRGFSYGRSEADAVARAEKLTYSIASLDSVLDLANGYAITRDAKFRGQQVEIEIQIPANRSIRFDRTVREKLNPSDFTIKKRYRRNRVVGVRIDDDYYFPFKTNVDYVMGIDGKLSDPRGKVVKEQNYEYRYQDEDQPVKKDTIKKELDKSKDEKAKEAKSTNNATESMDDKDEDVAENGVSAPLFSLATWF